jgi:hypothetical protein
MSANKKHIPKNYKLVLLRDGSVTFSRIYGYKKLYKFESVNGLLGRISPTKNN